ncbi:MAG: HD domain-containing phosphohydrolase, partial [Aeoliella sp.]
MTSSPPPVAPLDPFAPDSNGTPPAPSADSAAGAAPTPPRTPSPEVARELNRLGQAATVDGLMDAGDSTNQKKFQNQMVRARLGSAAGLFTALRCKHPATADHCLRVALMCSGWAAAVKLSDEQRSSLEVAALLHDLGKIGIPDAVLTKPGRLLPEEKATMAFHRQLAGDQIPRAARMLAIVDAFDSMITDHVYRPAKPRERALAELFDFAGTQFDPELVKEFTELVSRDQRLLTDQVASRWLTELTNDEDREWAPAGPVTGDKRPGDRRAGGSNALFEQKLVDNMHDGVMFVDNQRRIFLWNTGAERLTGIAGSAACGRTLEPSLLQMSTADGGLLPDNNCPVAKSIQSGVQTMLRVGVLGRSGRHVTIDRHGIPVHGDSSNPFG